MDKNGIREIVLTPERYEELIDAEQIYARKHELLQKEFDKYREEEFEFFSIDNYQHWHMVKKESLIGEYMAEIKRLREEWTYMKSSRDKMGERLNSIARKLEEKPSRIPVIFWIMLISTILYGLLYHLLF